MISIRRVTMAELSAETESLNEEQKSSRVPASVQTPWSRLGAVPGARPLIERHRAALDLHGRAACRSPTSGTGKRYSPCARRWRRSTVELVPDAQRSESAERSNGPCGRARPARDRAAERGRELTRKPSPLRCRTCYANVGTAGYESVPPTTWIAWECLTMQPAKP